MYFLLQKGHTLNAKFFSNLVSQVFTKANKSVISCQRFTIFSQFVHDVRFFLKRKSKLDVS